jgi:PAS domain S-box-containing protein
MSAVAVALLAVILAASAAALYVRARGRLRSLRRKLAGTTLVAPEVQPEQILARRREQFTALRAQADLARERRSDTERLAAETAARCALALQGAPAATWEWNLVTGEGHYSAAWKGLLGYEDGEVGTGFDEWLGRVHPDERATVEHELGAHLAGATMRFEVEHRLRDRAGNWRWVLARATAVRNEDGAVHRLVGLKTDISGRRKSLELMLDIADGLSVLSGSDCCGELVRRLAAIVGAPEAFLCVCPDRPATRARMLAHWTSGGDAELEEFELEGTPCREVIEQGRTVFAPRGVKDHWPQEHRECGTEAYLGLPCFDSEGQVIGHIVCKSRTAMSPDLPHQAVLKLFSLRAAVELERYLGFRAQQAGAVA